MGNTKRTVMKINDILTNETTVTNLKTKQANTSNFQQWLEERQIAYDKLGTPTKQCSGDEYYWEHQQQLQQSNLAFNFQPTETSTPPLSFTDKRLHGEDLKLPEAQMHYEVFTHSATVAQTNKSNQEVLPLRPYIYSSGKKNNNNSFYHFESTEVIEELENLAQETKKPQEKPLPAIQFKPYHLFMHSEYAELSLNLNSFSIEEQKELLHQIQQYLKLRGLTLSRLIINGVKHD